MRPSIITLALATAIAQAVPLSQRALYLAPRLDGQPGTGTLTDPFNASDPERLWASWLKTAFRKDGVTKHMIIFLPGVYSCTNELRLPFDAKDVTISGYGAQIVYADQALEGQRTILGTAWEGNDAISIQGFTLDCGSGVKFLGNGKVCGVYSRGRNNVVRDITVRDLASYNKAPFSVGQESFGITLHADGGLCSGNIITGTGGGGSQILTGIAVSGNDCSVNGNMVDFSDDNPTNAITSFGYSIYGNRAVFSANVARGVDAAMSMDGAGGLSVTNTWQDNVIVGNMFSGNEMAVRIQNNSQQFLNWLWVGNNFRGQGRSWLSMWTPEAWRANKISGHVFVGNMFSGEAQKINLRLSNFRDPHAFIGNGFTLAPGIDSGTNRNIIYGSGNTVRGREDNKVFGAK